MTNATFSHVVCRGNVFDVHKGPERLFEVQDLSHELLGVCASVGAQRAAALSRELQQAAKAEYLGAVARGLPAVEAIITDTHRVFKKALGVSVDPAVQA